VLVGLAPALAATGRQLRAAGADGGRSVAGGATARRIRQILVVTQFAIAIVLLTGAGLLARSWWHVQQIDPGFKPDRILSLQLSTPAPWSAAQRVAFYDTVLEQVRRLPGVLAAGTIGDLFVSTVAEATMTPEAEGPAIPHTFRLRRDEVSPGFFEAVTAPVIEGRAFTDSDRSDGPRVAVINRLLASRLWAGEAAIGKRFTLGSDAAGGAPFTVVGVVGDMHRQGLEGELTAQMFEPLAQNPSRLETLIVHTSHDNPLTVAGPIEAIVHRIDPHVPIYGLTTLDARLGSYLAERRMQTALLIGFAGIALVMAWIGIHGLTQYSVTTRRREIAIRMAVGARSADVFWMILAEGLKLSATGLAIGLIGALLLSRAASSLLFGIRSNDPSTFAVVALLLIAVAGAASFVPARRATRTEAVIALRAE